MSKSIVSLLKKEPSFLDAQEWRNVLTTHDETTTHRAKDVGLVNQTLAQVATLRSLLDHLDWHDEVQVHKTLSYLCSLRKEIKPRLEANIMDEKHNIHTPILCCKDSNYLLALDTTVVKILDSKVLTQNSINLLLTSHSPGKGLDVDTFRQFLDGQIFEHLGIFQANLVIASKETPFAMRKMAFLCRIMLEDRKRRDPNRHPVWALYETAITGISRPGWLAKVEKCVND